MDVDLKQVWTGLASGYTDNTDLVSELWNEIEAAYSASNRHYHNLTHLSMMIGLAQTHREKILDYDTLLFSIFYHDLVYKATNKHNEEQSAEICAKRLSSLGVPQDQVDKCRLQILATKSHESSDGDTNYLIDFDLAILSEPWQAYEQYVKAIRAEYAVYPGFLYRKGRKKVLSRFLKMKWIYKTDAFRNEREEKARTNLHNEQETL